MSGKICERLSLITEFLLWCAVLGECRSPALILTPFIKSNNVELARNASVVDPSYFLNVKSHSGFFTVDERHTSNMFFWYFPVAQKPIQETPWIVWLQGGPGASSVAGLFDEIGPFEYVNRTLKLRKWSWTSSYSVLFIDNPVGAGFSFTNSFDGFIEDMPMCATHLYKFLQQFLTVFPDLQKAPLYIAGESYAGRYLPALGLKILELGPLTVNLQGIIMGNPVLNRDVISDYSAIYRQWGLIDSQGTLAVKPLQDAYNKAIRDNDGRTAMELRDKLLDRLSDISMQAQNFNPLADVLAPRLKSFINYISDPRVAEAIHVGAIKFTFSNGTVHVKLTKDFMSEVDSKIETLLEHYRILIYCGQLDLTAPCVPNAQDRRKKWHWSGRNHFLNAPRIPWWYNNSVAGYVKSGGRFTEVLIRGAGHLVPVDKPAQLHQLISFFIRGVDLPIPPNYNTNSDFTPEYRDIYSFDDKASITVATDSSGIKIAMGISIFINIMLIFLILAGIVFCLRWKRRNEMFMYNNVEETSITEGVLAMS